MNDSQARRPIRDHNVWKAYERRRYAVLFYSLLLMLVLPELPLRETAHVTAPTEL